MTSVKSNVTCVHIAQEYLWKDLLNSQEQSQFPVPLIKLPTFIPQWQWLWHVPFRLFGVKCTFWVKQWVDMLKSSWTQRVEKRNWRDWMPGSVGHTCERLSGWNKWDQVKSTALEMKLLAWSSHLSCNCYNYLNNHCRPKVKDHHFDHRKQ